MRPPDPVPPKKRDFAKGLSPDVLQMFHDAQSNILELNKSRLQALEELKYARNRIEELEREVRRLQDQPGAGQNGSQPSYASSTVAQEPAKAAGNGAGAPPSGRLATPPPPSSPPAPAAPRKNVIRLVYSSGWKQPHVHFKKNGAGWTQIPGQKMLRGTGDFNGMWVAELDANSVEFVLNNGDNDWDSPDPSSGNKNYTINSHGTYRLKSGVVQKLP